MGEIYLARMTGEDGFERLVAVKVIHEHLTVQPQFVKMFIDEARLASRISHPNVAMTLDLGRAGASHFIAMEYVAGESLVALLKRARPPYTSCARIVSDAAAGLHAAHELRGTDGGLLNVVHRDVSPQNILLSYEGAVKVVDFGVARARGSLHSTSGELKGKFAYMAPEQILAPETVDRRADIFALGVVLHECSTYRRLFRGETDTEKIGKVIKCEVPPPSTHFPDYPAALEAIVMKALAREPSARFQTAAELHEQLERYIVSSGEPVPASTIGRMMRQVFADRIAEKQELLERCQHGGEVEAVPDASLVSGGSLVVGSKASFFTARPRRVAVGVAAGALVLGGLVLLLFLLKSGEGERAIAAAPAVPEISISISAAPSTATIELDGKPVTNPYAARVPRGSGERVAVVSAPGHRPQRIVVPLASGGAWAIQLEVELSPPPKQVERPGLEASKSVGKKPRRGAGKPAGKKQRGVDDKDVLANPYR
jgi:hypothetical protein